MGAWKGLLQGILPGLFLVSLVCGGTGFSSPATDAVSAATTGRNTGQRHLLLFWNQHQPSYKDVAKNRFSAPWVRLHALRDYYTMPALLLPYPDVHVTFNLSSTLLLQLLEYVKKLEPFAEPSGRAYGQLGSFPWGRLDPELDLTLKPVSTYASEDISLLLSHFFILHQDSMLMPYPSYRYLLDKLNHHGREALTPQDLLDLKIWYNLAWCHAWFRQGEYPLIGEDPQGRAMTCRLTQIARMMRQGLAAGYRNAGFIEEDARQLVLEQYQILKFIIPIHRLLQHRGRIEVMTTPYAHPILPLLHDTDLADKSNPQDAIGERFSYPQDAHAHVAKGAALYRHLFGVPPRGMWPGEGAVAEEVVPHFLASGIRWIATGQEVGARSGHFYDPGMFYRVDADPYYLDHDNDDAMTIFFRTGHDYIGFDYGRYRWTGCGFAKDGAAAANDFLGKVKYWRHWGGVPDDMDIYYMNTADGENVWQMYDQDGAVFLNALYASLQNGTFSSGYPLDITTLTPSEALDRVKIDAQWELEPLAPGSWVNGTFSTWAGECEENAAWALLKKVRQDLADSGSPRPPLSEVFLPFEPERQLTPSRYLQMAWEELYYAEGSDWWWWFGDDKNTPDGTDWYFDWWFRTHLANIYPLIEAAGYRMPWPAKGLPRINPKSPDILRQPSL